MENKIGTVIAGMRRQRGMTQEQLAEAVGVSPPAVSKWETNTSCPDVALLVPIARALDTDVNTLLSFTADYPAEELGMLLEQLTQQAAGDPEAALARMRELVRRYPNDAALRFQLASAAMGLPPLHGWSAELEAEARRFAEEGLEFIRHNGERKLWYGTTYMLAGLLLGDGELARAEALLDSLPKMDVLPRTLYAAIYQKRGEREKARKTLRVQLMLGEQAVLNSLSPMASMSYAETEEEAREACRVYRDAARLLGYPAYLGEVLEISLELELGRREEALDRLAETARHFLEDAPHRLWEPPMEAERYGEYRRNLGKLLHSSLASDEAFDSVRQDPRYREAMRLLDPET